MIGVKTMELVKVNKAFNYSPLTNQGIFYYLQNMQEVEVPWKEENISQQLDYYYHLNYSGNKNTSPLIEAFLTDGVLSSENKSELAKIIYSLFGSTGGRMWELYNVEYNPIQNYDMTEHMESGEDFTHGKTETRTDNLTLTRTDNLTNTETDNTLETRTPNITNTETDDTISTRTPDLSEMVTPETTKTTEKSVYGFNSVDAEPSEVIVDTDGGQSTRTNTGEETVENTGTITYDETGTETLAKTGTVAHAETGTQTHVNTGTQTLANSGKDTKEGEHTLTRYGNIGVTTSQQMLQSEIDLWQWNYFKNVIFPNIDGVLTLDLY